MRRRIREAWSLEPLDFHGTTEAAVPAASRPGQVGMDILEDLVVLEVVDQHHRPVPPGIPGHKVLLTNLVNHAQPLIRYELTDSLILAEEPNPLGLPYARIAAIDGHSDDIITLPAAGGGQVAVHPFRLRAPFATLPEVASIRSATTTPACTCAWSCARPSPRTLRRASEPRWPASCRLPKRSHQPSRSTRTLLRPSPSSEVRGL